MAVGRKRKKGRIEKEGEGEEVSVDGILKRWEERGKRGRASRGGGIGRKGANICRGKERGSKGRGGKGEEVG